MGALISIFEKLCAKEHEQEQDVQIHDVDIVCCSTVVDSSSESSDEAQG